MIDSQNSLSSVCSLSYLLTYKFNTSSRPTLGTDGACGLGLFEKAVVLRGYITDERPPNVQTSSSLF